MAGFTRSFGHASLDLLGWSMTAWATTPGHTKVRVMCGCFVARSDGSCGTVTLRLQPLSWSCQPAINERIIDDPPPPAVSSRQLRAAAAPGPARVRRSRAHQSAGSRNCRPPTRATRPFPPLKTQPRSIHSCAEEWLKQSLTTTYPVTEEVLDFTGGEL